MENDKDNHFRRFKEYIPAGSKESMDSWLYIYSYLNVKRKLQPDNSRLDITAFCFPGFFLDIFSLQRDLTMIPWDNGWS